MGIRFFSVLLAMALLCGSALPAAAYTAQEQQELQIGDQVYRQLDRQGKILRESPYYAILTPIGRRIATAADKKYFVPFRFILVHDKQPNAFSVPGGNVYVTDSMMTLVQNKEELAGVLCHETSHTIHHDVYDLYVKSQRVSLWATLGQLLLGQSSRIVSFAIDLLANVQMLRFSREVEHNADVSGAYVCSGSGITPWGMVWMMKRFLETSKSNPPEFLSDHPTDSHRIADLEKLFADNPQTFSRFNRTIANGTPLQHAGLRNQYAVAVVLPSASPAPAPAPVKKSIPVRPRAKPTCPPGWKFCPRPVPR